jgi:hypothetical protein
MYYIEENTHVKRIKHKVIRFSCWGKYHRCGKNCPEQFRIILMRQ